MEIKEVMIIPEEKWYESREGFIIKRSNRNGEMAAVPTITIENKYRGELITVDASQCVVYEKIKEKP